MKKELKALLSDYEETSKQIAMIETSFYHRHKKVAIALAIITVASIAIDAVNTINDIKKTIREATESNGSNEENEEE